MFAVVAQVDTFITMVIVTNHMSISSLHILLNRSSGIFAPKNSHLASVDRDFMAF